MLFIGQAEKRPEKTSRKVLVLHEVVQENSQSRQWIYTDELDH